MYQYLFRAAKSLNVLFLMYRRQAKVPTHSSHCHGRLEQLVCGLQHKYPQGTGLWKDEDKEDEDPANLTRELNIWMCQEYGSRWSLIAQFEEKQTPNLQIFFYEIRNDL